jgi:hypothetical protein
VTIVELRIDFNRPKQEQKKIKCEISRTLLHGNPSQFSIEAIKIV